MTNIPKIIHFFHDADLEIWQKSKSPQLRMCYMSWKRFCPDYKIMHWHDKMPEFQQMLKDSKFLREVYKRKMWAFVADYIRHYAIYHYGGIYVDTDVELLKSFDNFLDKNFFCSIEGSIFNNEDILESAVIGGEKGHIVFKEMLDIYNSNEIFKISHPIDPLVLKDYLRNKINFKRIQYNDKIHPQDIEKCYNVKDCTTLNNINLYQNQEIFFDEKHKIHLYPAEYFCPRWNVFGEKSITNNTVAIHWNQSSWWGNKKDAQNINEIESFKYNSKLKRFIGKHILSISKLLTFFILNKTKRREKRNIIKKKLIDKLGE